MSYLKEMSNDQYIESGLIFSFPEEWIVHDYDSHRFYKYLSGEGLKGVDFIAIHQDELILIEVKNYTDRIERGRHIPTEAINNEPETFVNEFVRKFKDSFRLLKIIGQYYERQWWYRYLFLKFRSWFPESFLLKTETGFWTKAIELAEAPEKISLILWLEFPDSFDLQKQSELRQYFKNSMQADLRKNTRLIVTNSKLSYSGIVVENQL